MDDKTVIRPKRNHNIQTENRRKAVLSGIESVVSFSDTQISLITSEGGLVIGGVNLKITKFSVEEGILSLDGEINSLRYVAAAEKKSFLKRLFK